MRKQYGQDRNYNFWRQRILTYRQGMDATGIITTGKLKKRDKTVSGQAILRRIVCFRAYLRCRMEIFS